MHVQPVRSTRRGAIATMIALALGSGLVACSGGGKPAGPTDPTGPGGPSTTVAWVGVTLGVPAISVGDTLTPAAAAKDAQGKAVTTTFTWRSSNSDVMSVGADGRAIGVTSGSATLTATSGNSSGSAEVKVEMLNLDAMVETVRTAHGLPAMAGAIVTSKGLIGIGVAGGRHGTSGRPAVTKEDKWHIGANLKGITATLAALAVSRGDIKWTQTIAESFPEHAATMDEHHRDVTLEELLANRDRIADLSSFYVGATAREQRESMIREVLNRPLRTALSYHYFSDADFVIAGAMIERAMNGTYEDLLTSELGAPLGVTSLGWGPAAAYGTSDQPHGHTYRNGMWVAVGCDNPPGLSAAGDAHMSIGDWAKFIQQTLAADAGRSTLITQANQRKVFTGHTPMGGSSDSYGLGWVITTRPWASGGVAIHEGTNERNFSVAWLDLEAGVAFLAVTNASNATGVAGIAVDDLAERMRIFYVDGK